MLTKMVESSRSVSLLRDLANSMELIQRSGSDPKVRARALQWLNILKVRLLESLGLYADDILKTRKVAQQRMMTDINDLSAILQNARTLLYERIAANRERITNLSSSIELFGEFSKGNKALIEANKKYCETESLNYNSNKNRINGEITLFREITKYFLDHYDRIHSFIRRKYNN